MFNELDSTQQVPQRKQTEEIEDIEIRITESPPERDIDFKALDLNGVTICFDAQEVDLVYGGNGLIYVSVMGNLIVLYDRKEDLNGFWFAAESIQKIKIDEYSKPENRERMPDLTQLQQAGRQESTLQGSVSSRHPYVRRFGPIRLQKSS